MLSGASPDETVQTAVQRAAAAAPAAETLGAEPLSESASCPDHEESRVLRRCFVRESQVLNRDVPFSIIRAPGRRVLELRTPWYCRHNCRLGR
jgi:hypothetical protein